MSALLQVNDIHAAYGRAQALFGVSFEVRQGEVVTLLGRNGAGRTTTLRAVMGLTGLRKGSIRINGEETITIQPESQAKARIPVQAQVGNGSAILTVTLRSIEGVPVGQPVGIPVNVRADWETWGLTAVGIAFVGLITAGVIRTLRRRKQGQSEDV